MDSRTSRQTLANSAREFELEGDLFLVRCHPAALGHVRPADLAGTLVMIEVAHTGIPGGETYIGNVKKAIAWKC